MKMKRWSIWVWLYGRSGFILRSKAIFYIRLRLSNCRQLACWLMVRKQPLFLFQLQLLLRSRCLSKNAEILLLILRACCILYIRYLHVVRYGALWRCAMQKCMYFIRHLGGYELTRKPAWASIAAARIPLATKHLSNRYRYLRWGTRTQLRIYIYVRVIRGRCIYWARNVERESPEVV